MELADLNQKAKSLLDSAHFKTLSEKLREPNIFRILGISSYEIRHSNFLAWLLDPGQNHGIELAFLEKTIEGIKKEAQKQGKQFPGIEYKNVIVFREWNNIDILILVSDANSNNYAIVIENKIKAKEGFNQLGPYYKKILHYYGDYEKLFVFLTIHGGKATHEAYINYSYDDILSNLNKILTECPNIQSNVKTYIKDYIENMYIYKTHMSEAIRIAQKLYYQNKELFDFVLKNRPDPIADMEERITNIITEKGWIKSLSSEPGVIRFLPKQLLYLFPETFFRDEWSSGESFLFELHVYSHQVLFLATVSFWQKEVTKILVEILNNALDKEREFQIDDWNAYQRTSDPISIEEFLRKSDDEINADLRKMVEKFSPKVKVIEALILQVKDKIEVINNSNKNV